MYDKCQTLYDSSPHWAVPFTFLSTTCVCRSCWRWCIQNHPIPSSVMSTITLVNAHHLFFLSVFFLLTHMYLHCRGGVWLCQDSRLGIERMQVWIAIQSAASSPLLLSYGYTLNLSDETTGLNPNPVSSILSPPLVLWLYTQSFRWDHQTETNI